MCQDLPSAPGVRPSATNELVETLRVSLLPLGYLRLYQIIGDRKSHPPIPPLIPVSRSTWLAGVRDGTFPQPVRGLFGKRITVWRLVDIQELLGRI